MYKTILVLSMALAVLAVSAGKMEGKQQKGGKEGHHHKMMNLTCKGENLDGKMFWAGKKTCFDEILGGGTTTTTAKSTGGSAAHEDHKEMMEKWKENELCVDVCAWKKSGFLNADGTYSKDGADKMVKATFPAKAQVEMKKAFDECAAANSKSLSTDNKCASYKAFKDCKSKKFMEICEIKHPKQSSEEN